ncbi:MAG: VWA domain-containing protein [Flavobacteriaceae bacterium]|nr:MAG: VWA domain-containing protein [Flavobacteriaceae bacterium]
MFEPDEYIFTKFAYFFKRRNKRKKARDPFIVNLEEVKPRLLLFSRAITGESIEIFEAEREGGYKDNNFFLPSSISCFNTIQDNLSYYLFRILYLSVQKNLNLNWSSDDGHSLSASRKRALLTSELVLKELFSEFPITREYHQKLVQHYTDKTSPDKEPDFSFIYGKWMINSRLGNSLDPLKNFGEEVKTSDPDSEKTVLEAKGVEEIVSVQIDQKQLDDAVLQHQFEKVETADEFGGNFRDMDGDDDLKDHENALDELQMKFTVRVDDTAHSVYQAEFTENTTIAESAETLNQENHLLYDEWDFSKRIYKKGFCKVYPKRVEDYNIDFYKSTIDENASTLMGLRKMLTSFNNKFQQQRKQNDGDEFELDAITDLFVDIHTGHTPSENIYLSKRKKEKDISILLLLDASLSSDAYAAGSRVIDVEKQVSILFGEILDEFKIDFSINAFYSKTRNHTSYINLKEFDEPWSGARYKIGAIKPSGYTRIGAALRHSASLLDNRESRNKWLILISDGKPNDYDRYEGKYGVNDVKQAIRELHKKDINAYALAIEAQAKYYLPQMFGKNHYQILTRPVELLNSLVHLYEKIKHQG